MALSGIVNYLSQSGDKHYAGDESNTSDECREEGENYKSIADMHVADVHEFVGDYVVAVVSRARSCH